MITQVNTLGVNIEKVQSIAQIYFVTKQRLFLIRKTTKFAKLTKCTFSCFKNILCKKSW